MSVRGKMAFVLAALAGAAAAQAPQAHVHGAAELAVVIDGGTIDIVFESPLDNLLGFERAPKSDAERAAVGAMAGRFRAPPGLFVPTPAADCRAPPAELSSPVLDPALLQGKPAGAASGAGKGGADDAHAELRVHIVYSCAKVAALAGLEVRVFDAFANVRRIDAALAGPKGQSATTLTTTNRMLKFEK
jgi:hypothetical protein